MKHAVSSKKAKQVKSFKRILKKFLLALGVLTSSSKSKKIGALMVITALLVGVAVYSRNQIYEYASKNVVVSEGEIIKRIKTHTSVPDEEPISIVRVQDADSLRAQHSFYKDVKEGNYIVVYTSKVIIYDLLLDKIVAEKKSGE